jgi:uncharacterized membrane protein
MSGPGPSRTADQRHGRDTNEFARVVNLSDAVFAIAMTLLVLTVDVPDVPTEELAAALRDDLPQLGAYVLAFALVASQWFLHRKVFQRLAWTEPGIVIVNLAFLGGVALVPFPTSVLGSNPTATVAVAPFLALFVLLNLGYVAMIARAQRQGAWLEPLPSAVYRRVQRGFAAGTAALLLGVVLAFWVPLLALATAAVSGLPTVLIMRGAPARYRSWF